LNDWRIQPWVGGPTNFAANTQAHVYLNNNSTPAVPADDYYDATVINPPFPGQLYGMPNDVRYTFSDRSSERGNAQLTLQFAPSDAWTFTANYAWLDNRLREDRGEQTVWMQNTGFHRIEFDTNEAVATPLVLEEYTGAGKDYSFSQGHRAQRNGLQTYGLNTEWQVSEKFRLTLDLSDAAARSRADDPLTGAGETEMAIAGRLDSSGSCISPATCTNFWTQGFRFDGALPIATRTVYPTSTDAFAGMGGDSNYTFDETSLGTQWLNLYLNEEFVDLRQSRLDGLVEFSKGSFAFGIEMRALEAHVRRAESAMVLGDWSVSDAGNVPGMVSLLEPFGLIGAFEEHRAPGVPTGGWKGNANALASWAIAPLSQGGGGYGDWIQPGAPDGELRRNADYVFDTRIAEDTTAAYVQATWHGEILARRANLRVGLRYENTDVSSTSSLYLPEAPVWVGADIFVQLSSDQLGQVGAEDDYDYFLPSFDFDIALNDSLKARVSYGSTIARASYNNYSPRVALGDFRGSTLNGYRATANGFNPALLPLQSDNLDLSLEWYFADRGYFAVTWWDKHVTNFIGDAVFEEQLYGFRDQSAGPRAQAALAELQRRGLPTDDASLFTMIAMTEHPEGATHPNGTFYPGGAAAFDGSLGQRMAFGLNYDILPTPDDPLRTYNVTRPVNARAANVHGWELGGQYFFGDTGFGVLANYTAVDGDVHYDVTSSPQQNQFALLGLSDSANAVLMYEKHGISVRLAWNWRDQFLQQVNYPMHRNPIFVGEYQQFDLGLSYDIGEHLTLSLEGINLTGEDTRWHGRSERQIWSLEDQGARFSIGIQYRL
jgi:TonB-dependent receptor